MASIQAASVARAAPCAGPVLSRADTAALQRAVVVLPAVGSRAFPMGVRALVPSDILVKTVPAPVVKLLPQYAGYRAFRSGFVLMIVNPRTRRIPTGFLCGMVLPKRVDSLSSVESVGQTA